MRNKFAGPCYRCSDTVPAGEGYFERFDGHWRVIHKRCVYAQRLEKERVSDDPHQPNKGR